jgi:hypothetical protein
MQQQSRLQEISQPVDQLDREIDEIRRLMLESSKKTRQPTIGGG